MFVLFLPLLRVTVLSLPFPFLFLLLHYLLALLGFALWDRLMVRDRRDCDTDFFLLFLLLFLYFLFLFLAFVESLVDDF